nr:hypothetical protein [Rhodococcus wratislaviensis]
MTVRYEADHSPAEAAFGGGDQGVGDVGDGENPPGAELVEAVEAAKARAGLAR